MSATPGFEACRLAATACACHRLRSAARAVSRIYERALAGAGLTATQFAILAATHVDAEVGLAGLARRLGLDRTTLYRGIRPLQRAGDVRVLARRGHAKALALTAAGRARLAAALPLWREAQSRLAAAFEADALEADALERLAADLDRLRATAARLALTRAGGLG